MSVGIVTAASVLALGVLTLNASAFAQADLRVLRERNVILQRQDIARQNALAAQREAVAAQNRYGTQLTLRSLDEAADPPTEPALRPALSAIAPRGPAVDDLSIDLERMDRMTDARLAESNARLRAVKPAS